MSHFKDGPADGLMLLLRRAPLLLRVVQDTGGKWDALDQLTDKPAAGESVTVYVRTNQPSIAHVDVHRGPGGSGWYQLADYQLAAYQPDDEEVRDNAAWQSWAVKHKSLLVPLTAYPRELLTATPAEGARTLGRGGSC